MSSVSRILTRMDGTEVKIVAQAMQSPTSSKIGVDVYVLHRKHSDESWKLASKTPHPDWLTMSVSDYVKHGRSEMLQLVTPGELLRASHELFQQMKQAASVPSV